MATKFEQYKEIIERLIGKKDEEPEEKKRVPLWEELVCMDVNHKPPGHLVIPAGTRYEHECPSCHNIIIIDIPKNFW